MHCKDVSMHDVDIPLDREHISELMRGWTAYVRTDDLVLRNGDSYAVVRLVKSQEPGLFRKVVDNVPPSPAKLGVLVDVALGSGFVDHPIVKEERIIDMAEKVSEVRTGAVMFPCRVSNLHADIPFCFLDDAPEDPGDITLIGCHLSQRIFRSLYDRDVPFVNVCPADFVEPGVKTIVKCCKVKQGHELDGDVVRVPWGATVPEVVDAINALFSPDSPQRACGRC